MSYHWDTNSVEAESTWTTSGVAPSSSVTTATIATTSTWVTNKIDTASTWSITDPMIAIDEWAILEAIPIYFSDPRKWNELRIMWGL